MNYYEIKTVVLLKESINQKNCGSKIGEFINLAMLKDSVLKALHATNDFKFYSFDNLYPLAENSIYHKNRIYTFRLRTIKGDLATKLYNALKELNSDTFSTISVILEKVNQRPIEELISLTPIIVTLEKDENKLLKEKKLYSIEQDIINGLVKRYNKLNNKNLSYDDARHIFQISQVKSNIIPVSYKGISLLGIKYKFKVSMDNISQELAFLAESSGLGEKCSSVGAGFCHANYVK